MRPHTMLGFVGLATGLLGTGCSEVARADEAPPRLQAAWTRAAIELTDPTLDGREPVPLTCAELLWEERFDGTSTGERWETAGSPGAAVLAEAAGLSLQTGAGPFSEARVRTTMSLPLRQAEYTVAWGEMPPSMELAAQEFLLRDAGFELVGLRLAGGRLHARHTDAGRTYDTDLGPFRPDRDAHWRVQLGNETVAFATSSDGEHWEPRHALRSPLDRAQGTLTLRTHRQGDEPAGAVRVQRVAARRCGD